jgi:hypothetical protein
MAATQARKSTGIRQAFTVCPEASGKLRRIEVKSRYAARLFARLGQECAHLMIERVGLRVKSPIPFIPTLSRNPAITRLHRKIISCDQGLDRTVSRINCGITKDMWCRINGPEPGG